MSTFFLHRGHLTCPLFKSQSNLFAHLWQIHLWDLHTWATSDHHGPGLRVPVEKPRSLTIAEAYNALLLLGKRCCLVFFVHGVKRRLSSLKIFEIVDLHWKCYPAVLAESFIFTQQVVRLHELNVAMCLVSFEVVLGGYGKTHVGVTKSREVTSGIFGHFWSATVDLLTYSEPAWWISDSDEESDLAIIRPAPLGVEVYLPSHYCIEPLRGEFSTMRDRRRRRTLTSVGILGPLSWHPWRTTSKPSAEYGKSRCLR